MKFPENNIDVASTSMRHLPGDNEDMHVCPPLGHRVKI